MIVGHYATALVARRQHRRLPLWSYLLAAMSLDIVMITLVLSGVEQMAPLDPESPKLAEMVIDMTYSHDLLAVAGWATVVGLAGWGLARSVVAGLWLGGLVVLHEVCDLLSGFHHFVWGPDSPRVGLGTYTHAPLLAVAIEVAVCVLCTWWFLRGSDASPKRVAGLYAVMLLGCAALLPFAL